MKKYSYLVSLSAPMVSKTLGYKNKYELYAKRCMFDLTPTFMNENMVNIILSRLKILNELDKNINKFYLITFSNNRTEIDDKVGKFVHCENENINFNILLYSTAYFLNKSVKNEKKKWSSYKNFNEKFEKISKLHYMIDTLIHKEALVIFLFSGFYSWREIVELFAINNLLISSGSENIKGALSPNESNLKIATILLGLNINESFRNTLIEHKKNQPNKDYRTSEDYKFFKKENIINSDLLNVINENLDKADKLLSETPNINTKSSENLILKNKSFVYYGQKREYHFSQNINQKSAISTMSVEDDKLIQIEELIKIKKINKIINRIEYNSINELINKTELTDREKQFEIETFYINTIKMLIDDIIRNPKLFNTNYGFKILSKAIKDLDEKLNDFKKPKYLIRKKYAWIYANLSNSIIISSTFSILFPLIYSKENPLGQNYTNIIYKVGINLYKSYMTEQYIEYLNILNTLDKKKKEKDYYNIIDELTNKEITIEIIGGEEKKSYQEFSQKICFSEILDEDFYDIGHDIIQFLDLTTDYIKIDNRFVGKNKRENIILPGKDINDLIDISLMDVSMLPMICKPNDWSVKKVLNKVNNNIKLNKNIEKDKNLENENKYEYKVSKYGGYLLNENEHNHFIHKHPINAGEIRIITDDIINTINYIQSVPFQINLNVLYFLLKLINENKHLDDPLFFSLHKEDKKIEEFRKNKEIAKVNEILRHNSIANNNIATLSAAIVLRKNTFYNPIFTDWRGRIYASNTLLSFLNNEINRSLLYFVKGNRLNDKGLDSLKIYTANCYGHSKKSYKYRINWVNDNIKSILNIDSDFWLEAKERLLFIACSYELIDYYKDPQNFISKLPIFLDATASGLQHLSVMTKDINLAKYVNILKSSTDENPFDIYKLMCKKVSDIINNIPDYHKFAIIKKLDIENNRDFLKLPGMTTTYGATIRGIKDQLISIIFIKTDEKHRYTDNLRPKLEKVTNIYKVKDEKFIKEEFRDGWEPFKIKGTEIMYLAKTIHSTLYNTYPSLKTFVNYLQQINEFLKEISLDIGVVWNTPSGLNLEQKYLETISIQRTKNVLGRRKSYSVIKTIPTVNVPKQKRGLMPNLIHSMDAANIALLVNLFIKNNNNINLVTVHDCFVTDGNNIEMLHFHVRLAFLRIYQDQNFIENFHNDVINYLKKIGIKFNNDNTKIYLNNNQSLNFPNKPNFKNNIDLSYNLFNSPYFIN